MPIDIKILCRQISPEHTVLLFGAGSSIPSGGPSAAQLTEQLATRFNISQQQHLQLSEVCTIIEKRHGRRELISFLRSIISPLKPTGSLLNLPLYDWRSIYTTNYDTLVEQAYSTRSRECVVYSSNFDFQLHEPSTGIKLYKIHGTIESDISYGNNSRIIITVGDYDWATEYRELLYNRFRVDISEGFLLIIGYSLSDPDLKHIIDDAIRLKRQIGGLGKIFLLLYEHDPDRALIIEDRGISVCFASLDDFFSEMAFKLPAQQLVFSISDDPLDVSPELRPCTVDVAHAAASERADAPRMFNGSAATYADTLQNLTFERGISNQIEAQMAGAAERVAYVLGAAGVGKTTAARQAILRLSQRGQYCWEHKDDFVLGHYGWHKVDDELVKRKVTGVLLIDDCHSHIREVNRLVDDITKDHEYGLKIILVSTKHHWNPRLKAPAIFTHGRGYELSRLSDAEINSLLELLDRQGEIRSLVEDRFLGFARPERRRRLVERCSADMFVCLKNIFGFESIDDIILKEYAELTEAYQDIYRTVSAMEAAGVRVHRQLVIRTLGIPAHTIAAVIGNLTDIITEYTISEKEGLYGWRGRHSLVAEILTSYKFVDPDEIFRLFETIVLNLNPTYDIEVRTIRDMCDMKAGLGRVKDRTKQNYLLRRMISLVPAERVPRHRLIYNLIEQGEYEQAETEIRIFEKELRLDAPTLRYKVRLHVRRAENAKGILVDDRAAILLKAEALADGGTQKFRDDKNLYRTYCEVGITYFRLTGSWDIYDRAMAKAKEAENWIMDPDLRRTINLYEGIAQRMQRGGGN